MTGIITSFILPSYRRRGWFLSALPLNRAYFNPNNEVVICLESPEETDDYLRLCESFKGRINFKLIVCDTSHVWRPPCKAINAGVRVASGEHIAVLSPETVLHRFGVSEQHPVQCAPQTVLTGMVWAVAGAWKDAPPERTARLIAVARNTMAPYAFGFGFFLCQRQAFHAINGMDESRTTYGRDDDDIRIRLIRSGCSLVVDPLIEVFHLHHATEVERDYMAAKRPNSAVVLEAQPDWGLNEFTLRYSWEVT